MSAEAAGKTPQCQFTGRHKAGKTQLAGRRPPTLNKPHSTQTYIASHLNGLSRLSLYLRSTQEMSSPLALIWCLSMQLVVMHVITLCGVYICLWFSPPQEGQSPVPRGLQSVSGAGTCIFKNQPWAHCCPVPLLQISQGCGGLSGPGGTQLQKMHGGVLKEGFLLNILMSVWSRGHACWRPCGKTFGHRLRRGEKHVVTHKWRS